ncbi:MAG: hypothetical protein NXH75_11560, partial [Halobacteriovoraceae bacterium]|nr:hypothetical protein [Halobacteriovoraceae bacterium]
MNQGRDKLNFRIFTFVFLIIILINIYVFQGMFHSLAFASITAGTFYPIYQKCRERFKVSDEIAAAIVTTLIFVLLVLPLIFIIFQVSKETVDLYGNIREGLSLDNIKNFFFGEGLVGSLITRFSELLGIEVNLSEIYSGILSKAQS